MTRRLLTAAFVLAAAAAQAQPTAVPEHSRTPSIAYTGQTALNENRRTITLRLNGEPFVVNGNNNRLTLQGTCQTLTVNGNGNHIDVEAVGTIAVLGNRNKVEWRTGTPALKDVGNHNKLRPR